MGATSTLDTSLTEHFSCGAGGNIPAEGMIEVRAGDIVYDTKYPDRIQAVWVC